VALVPLSEMLAKARAGGYAVGYFEAWDTYSFEAVVEAAEAERAPVVLGFGGMMMDQAWLSRYGIEPLGAYGRCIAERTSVPAALILNEVWEFSHACRGVDAGFNVVMLNTCELPFERNAALTRTLVEIAHSRGVEVQAELGRLPSVGSDDPGELTDPEEARAFVAATGVDFLAVSVGNVHCRTAGEGGIDSERLRAIRAAVGVPLVIHGGSGLSDDAVSALIREGVSLFHVGTIMKKLYLDHAAAEMGTEPFSHAGRSAAGMHTWEKGSVPISADYQASVGCRKPTDFLMPGRAAITAAIRALMRQYGVSGKAG